MNLTERIKADAQLLAHLGIEVRALDSANAQTNMNAEPLLSLLVSGHMVNALGFCHGGLLYALADTACAYALGEQGMAPATVDASVTYLKPGRLGERLQAHTEVVRASKRLGTCEVRITNPQGQLLALYRGTCANLNT